MPLSLSAKMFEKRMPLIAGLPESVTGGKFVCAGGRGASRLVGHNVFGRRRHFSERCRRLRRRFWRDAGGRSFDGVLLVCEQRNLAAQGGAAGLSSDYHTYGTIMLICGCAHVVAWLIFHAGVPRIQPAR